MADEWTGTWCPQCGSNVSIDEDGCCSSCGCVAVGDGVEEALAQSERLSGIESAATQVCYAFDAESGYGLANAIVELKGALNHCATKRDEARAEVDRLKAELANLREERRWVPVEERLPPRLEGDISERMFVVTDRGERGSAYYDFYLGEWRGGDFDGEVILWLDEPLPTPPGEKGE